MEAPGRGWGSAMILGPLVLGTGLLAGFVRAERRHPAPIIEVDLFASPTFSACNLVIFTAQYSKMALLGATVGMAVCSTLFSMSGSFALVFLSTILVFLAVFLLSLATTESPGPTQPVLSEPGSG